MSPGRRRSLAISWSVSTALARSVAALVKCSSRMPGIALTGYQAIGPPPAAEFCAKSPWTTRVEAAAGLIPLGVLAAKIFLGYFSYIEVMRLTNLSFEEWIEHAFSREVHIQQAAGTLIRITTGGIQSPWRPGISHASVRGSRADPVLVLGRPDCARPHVSCWNQRFRRQRLALRHGSPGRGPRPMRRGDRQALRSTVRSALHAASLAP